MAHLGQFLDDRLISLRFEFDFLSRLPDLTILDSLIHI